MSIIKEDKKKTLWELYFNKINVALLSFFSQQVITFVFKN